MPERKKQFVILKDFRSYAEAQKKVEEAYKDPDRWAKMALLNTASCGKFTSDRTIQEYVDNIWKLDICVFRQSFYRSLRFAEDYNLVLTLTFREHLLRQEL